MLPITAETNYSDFDIRHVAWFIAGFFTAISFVLCIILTMDHLQNLHQAQLQTYVVRIIWMVPVYSTNACLGLLTTDMGWLWGSLREFYEAFTIWSFLHLLFAMLEGEERIVHLLQAKPASPYPWPFCCTGDVKKNESFVHRVRFGVTQYVAIKPLVTISVALSKYFEVYGENEWSAAKSHIYLLTITNISQMVALYCLVMFYAELHRDLADWRPLPKFACIKMVVFFTYWQGLALSILTDQGVIKAYTPKMTHFTDIQVSDGLQNLFLTIEMVVFAAMHHFAFGVRQFMMVDEPETSILQALCTVLTISDVTHDIRMVTRKQEYERLRCCSSEVPSAQEYGSTVHPSDDHTPVGSIVHATRQEDDYHQSEDLTLIRTV